MFDENLMVAWTFSLKLEIDLVQIWPKFGVACIIQWLCILFVHRLSFCSTVMQVNGERIPSSFLASNLFYTLRPLNRFLWAALNLLVSSWMLLV